MGWNSAGMGNSKVQIARNSEIAAWVSQLGIRLHVPYERNGKTVRYARHSPTKLQFQVPSPSAFALVKSSIVHHPHSGWNHRCWPNGCATKDVGVTTVRLSSKLSYNVQGMSSQPPSIWLSRKFIVPVQRLNYLLTKSCRMEYPLCCP